MARVCAVETLERLVQRIHQILDRLLFGLQSLSSLPASGRRVSVWRGSRNCVVVAKGVGGEIGERFVDVRLHLGVLLLLSVLALFGARDLFPQLEVSPLPMNSSC